MVGLPPGGQYFLSKRKKVPKKARGTATPEAARPASRASVCGSPSGCPRPRGVRCRRSPCRSLCSPPTLPAGRFGLRPRPHWGHASLRDSSLRSPAGKKPSIAHFAGGVRNVVRNLVGQLTPSPMRAPVLTSFRRQNGQAFFPTLPIAALLRRRLGGGEGQIARLGVLRRETVDFARQKTNRDSKLCWLVARAGGPVAERR